MTRKIECRHCGSMNNPGRPCRCIGTFPRECNACDWVGTIADTVRLGSIVLLCPECHETTCRHEENGIDINELEQVTE